jgi:hypothetical protein
MKSNQIIATLVLLVVVGAAAFFGGVKFQQLRTVSQFGQRTGLNTQGMMGRNAGNATGQANRGQAAGFRQTTGEIISIDDKSMTVKLTDGSSKIVLFSDTTTVNQATAATKTDLKVGTKVAVMGDQNTDGSVTGRNIEINPRSIIVTPTVTPTAK